MSDGETTGGSTPADEAGDPPGGYSVILKSAREATGSDSYLLKSYAVVGTFVAALAVLWVVLAFPVWVSNSASGDTQAFSRAFLLLTGLIVVVGLVAPTYLAVRRRHKRGSSRRRDALYGLSGYLVVLGLFSSLLVSAPPDMRDPPPAAIAPVVDFLYGLDPVYSVVPPAIAAAVVLVVHRT